MPKVSAKKLDEARENALDALEDIVTTIHIMRAGLRVAKTQQELYAAVKPPKGALSPHHEAIEELDRILKGKD
jgi:hypothetical protein